MIKDGYKVLVLFDPHIKTKPDGKDGWLPDTSKALDTALQFGETWKPDETIMGHDFMEFDSISYWNRNKKLELEGRRLVHDFEYANTVLDQICRFTKTKVIFQPGNHDFWLDQYSKERPVLEGLINQPRLLKFKERGIIGLKYNEIYRIGKASFIHAFLRPRTFTTKYHTARMAEDYGSSIFYGHFHTFQAYTRVTWDSRPNIAVAIGCLSDLNPAWARNCPNNFTNQLLFLEFDKKGHFSFYAPIMIDGKFRYNGKEYGG